MVLQLSLNQIHLLPGQRVQLEQISWSQFEVILAELGEGRSPRITYCERTLEIMAPLCKHVTAKVFLGDFVNALLNELEID